MKGHPKIVPGAGGLLDAWGFKFIPMFPACETERATPEWSAAVLAWHERLVKMSPEVQS